MRLRQRLKRIAGNAFPTDFYERFVAHAALAHQFAALSACRRFGTRELLWNEAIGTIGADRAVTVLEFGVWQGSSLGYFARHFSHPQSIFIGCDSFEGLPERWGGNAIKGTFDLRGRIPQIGDPRVSLVKGWFQNTFDDAIAMVRERPAASVLVHFDADLYSSTLFLLTRLSVSFDRYTAIFDEFTGHETRALLNYMQAYGAEVEFLAATYPDGVPEQVLCRIECKTRTYRPQ